MKQTLVRILFTVVSTLCLWAQTGSLALDSEARKIDALTADPEMKLVVAAAMADQLEVHRNHLILLRKETDQPYSAIFVSALRERGMDDSQVLRQLRALDREVARRLDRSSVRPVLSLSSGADRSSAGAFYSLVPEIGVDSSHASLVVGIPYYRTSTANLATAGVGDVYVAGFLRGRIAAFDVGAVITAGAPTGDSSKGLGAGKASVDATGAIRRQFGFVRPWLSAGFTNSVFNNAGYRRPYVTNGNATHFSGGLDMTVRRILTFGAGGFALRPIGNQTVYSQTVEGRNTSQAPSASNSGGSMPGASRGAGMGGDRGGVMPPASSMPFYDRAQQTVVNAGELRDYGAAAWLSIPIGRGLSLNVAAARSIPFHLTTARVGIGIDVARMLFPGKRF